MPRDNAETDAEPTLTKSCVDPGAVAPDASKTTAEEDDLSTNGNGCKNHKAIVAWFSTGSQCKYGSGTVHGASSALGITSSRCVVATLKLRPGLLRGWSGGAGGH